jgi:uncharacterized protein YifN (PemK superfamily)
VILFTPNPGDVLVCDFSAGGFREPEMIKARPVVVISRKMRETPSTVIVVPFSATKQRRAGNVQHLIPAGRYHFFEATGDVYAKGDMVAHVSLARLDRLHKDGLPIIGRLDADDLRAVRACVLRAVGLSHLTA